jgi:hypothetical protein
MKKHLGYFEIHTETKTMYLHAIIEAEDIEGAFSKMYDKADTYKKEGISLQVKGVLEYTPENIEKFLTLKEVL